MKTLFTSLVLAALPLPSPPTAANADAPAATAVPADDVPTADVLIVLGAPGTDEYGQMFEEWAQHWRTAAKSGGASSATIGSGAGSPAESSPGGADSRGAGSDNAPSDRAGSGQDEASSDRDRLQTWLADAAALDRPLWIVLVGHGTDDGRTARFNLRGEDVTAVELADWLSPLRRPVALINCSSASAPFLAQASAPDRVVVTATKDGAEANLARFGGFLSAAVGDAASDLDKDGQVSLLEAFLKASRRTQEFYEAEGRLATEHALLDDDGDGRGTRADAFSGVQAVKESESGSIDGRRAHQWHLVPSAEERRLPPDVRRRRDELELAVIALRDGKASLGEEEYFNKLEALLIELATLYEQAEAVDSP